MRAIVDIDDDQVDRIIFDGLVNGFHVNLEFKDEPEYETTHNAFLTLIKYYSTPTTLEEFVKSIPCKKVRTESAKRLAEAYSGL